jgi:predicted nucleic acid-binding Zn ribbon protein
MKNKVKDTPNFESELPQREFERFLEVVNSVRGVNFLREDSPLNKTMELLYNADAVPQKYVEASAELLEEIKDEEFSREGLCFKLLGKNIENFDVQRDCYDIIFTYQTFWQNYQLLYRLVYLTRASTRNSGTLKEPRKRIIGAIQSSLLVINENGLIEDEAPQTNIFKGIEAKRIKICPVCRNYFWAKPMKKKTCSTKCSNYLKSKKRRENEELRRQDNEKRRETRQSKKEQQQAKEKNNKEQNNGTL